MPITLPSASSLTLSQLSETTALYPILLKRLGMRDAGAQQAKAKTKATAKKKEKEKGGLGGEGEGELVGLDRLRYEEVPGRVRGRKGKGKAWLEKGEVQSVVAWKLKHGKFRPQLPALVASNSEDAVEDITGSAFMLYDQDPSDPFPALKRLAELKGIGPATASLLLSIYDEEKVPFFSDELFRWVCWQEEEGGWERKIKYDWKEYRMLWEGVGELRRRLGEVKVVEVEKAAFVCGRLGVDDGGLREEVLEEGESGREEQRREVEHEARETEQEEHEKDNEGAEKMPLMGASDDKADGSRGNKKRKANEKAPTGDVDIDRPGPRQSKRNRK